MSILANLQHEHTPPELAHLNKQLSEALCSELVDEQQVQEIISQRANLVESLLNTLDEQQKKCFATCEINTNDVILAATETLRKQIRTELSKVSKASKAIKKYHQV